MFTQTTSMEEAAHLSGAEGWPRGGGPGAATQFQGLETQHELGKEPQPSGPYLPQGELATNKPSASMWRKRKQGWEKEGGQGRPEGD